MPEFQIPAHVKRLQEKIAGLKGQVPDQDIQLIKIEERHLVDKVPADHVIRIFDLFQLEPDTNCADRSKWTISASNTTGANGEAIIPLRDYLPCDRIVVVNEGGQDIQRESITGDEPYFIATANSENPVFLTFTYSELPPGLGVPNSVYAKNFNINVKSWNLDGTPAPYTKFAWHCVVLVTTLSIGRPLDGIEDLPGGQDNI